jgi:hypothetical protein
LRGSEGGHEQAGHCNLGNSHLHGRISYKWLDGVIP